MSPASPVPLPRSLILTGSRGRLAATLRAALAPVGWRVMNFSRSAGAGHLALEDLFTGGLLEGGAAALLHLAWSTVPLTSERHVGLEYHHDLPLLTRLLGALVEAGPRAPHLFFFSSGGTVYGNAPGRPSHEDDPLAPIGWHGHAKAAAERVVTEYGRRHGVRHTVFRLSNPYGFAAAGHRPQGIIPLLVETLTRDAPFTLWGDGHARKDFLFHTDLTDAVRLALETPPPGTFNLGAGISHSLREVIAGLETIFGRTLALTHSPAYSWDVADSVLDTSRLRDALNWTPCVGLEEGLARTVRALLSPPASGE